MAIYLKTYRPITPTRRFLALVPALKVNSKFRPLTTRPFAAQGRQQGQLIVRHKGGLQRWNQPTLYTKHLNSVLPSYLSGLIKTPRAQPFVGLFKYPTGSLFYKRLPHGVGLGFFLTTLIFNGYQETPRTLGAQT